MRVAIVDYGLGNIRSVVNALSCFDIDLTVAERGEELALAERIVLPGVGSFDAGMRGLRERGHDAALSDTVKGRGVPYLGICLGLQFLFEGSDEGGEPGLGWLEGRVRRLPGGPGNPKVPHIGWSEVRIARRAGLFRDMEERADFYFVHSYYVPLEGSSAAIATGLCDYGSTIVAALESGAIAAIQFHPEKSQLAGMKLLENFLNGAPT